MAIRDPQSVRAGRAERPATDAYASTCALRLQPSCHLLRESRTATGCPAVETLAAFIAGELTAAGRDALEAHLDACADCMRVIHAACGQPAAPTVVLGQYELLELIGRGGMGRVYRAIDRRTGRVVAVKRSSIPETDHELAARHEREVDALLRLRHPSIVGIEAHGVEAGSRYIVMEYVGGGSLRQHITRSPAWPVERALEVVIDIAGALARVHDLGVVHRDVKPENILIAASGKPLLGDFGLVTGADSPLTTPGDLLGTLAYLSPEALGGLVLDGRADIWSLGVVAFELVAGQHPFRGDSAAQTLGAILTRPVPALQQRRPDVSRAVVEVILRMLEKDRSRRLRSARQVAALLEGALATQRWVMRQGTTAVQPEASGQQCGPEGLHPPSSGRAAFAGWRHRTAPRVAGAVGALRLHLERRLGPLRRALHGAISARRGGPGAGDAPCAERPRWLSPRRAASRLRVMLGSSCS